MTFNEPIFYRKTSDESDDLCGQCGVQSKVNRPCVSERSIQMDIVLSWSVIWSNWTVLDFVISGPSRLMKDCPLSPSLKLFCRFILTHDRPIFRTENIKFVFYLTFMDVFFTLLAGRERDYLDVQRDNLKILSLTNSRNKSTLFFNPFKESDFKVNEFLSTSKI